MSALRSLWDEPRPPGAPSRVWRDWVLVCGLPAAAVLEGVLRPGASWRWLEVVTVVLLAPLLLWRRTHPLRTVAIAFTASGVVSVIMGRDGDLYTTVFMLMLPYALYRWGSGREVVLGSAVLLGNFGLTAAAGLTSPADAVGGLVVVAAVCSAGTAARFRTGLRSRELAQARLAERERIARDLHDVVGHHMSAVAVRAQAGLAASATRPEAATEALHVIEDAATQALAEMRTMVRILRADELATPGESGEPKGSARTDAPAGADLLAPGPSIAQLASLAGGPPPQVDVQVADGLDDLPAAVGAAVYRLAQESVTNARRHARDATRVVVGVTADGPHIRLRVSDDGTAPPHQAREGLGLAGMRERVSLLGGTFAAGPASASTQADPAEPRPHGRGWLVEAVLPRVGHT